MNENQAEQEYARCYIEYHAHQGLGNRTLPAAAVGPPNEPVVEPTPALDRVRCQ